MSGRQLAVLVAVLVVLVILLRLPPRGGPDPEALLPIEDPRRYAGLEIRAGEDVFSAKRTTDGTWSESEEFVDALFRGLARTARGREVPLPESIATFGLDPGSEPVGLSARLVDGTTIDLRFGATTPSEESVYVLSVPDSVVFLVPAGIRELLVRTARPRIASETR